MKTCKDCQHFNKKHDSPETVFSFNFCKKNHACFGHHPACNNFEETQIEINLNYLYIGLLRSCEFGLVEIEQDKTNYRRIEMGPGDWTLNRDYVTNAIKIIFPIAKKEWGVVTHFGVFDSLQKGNLLTIGELIESSITILKNMVSQWEKGNLSVSLEAIGIKI